MNRIEQAATPAPSQQPQPRLPRALADVRRRAAQVLMQPRDASHRTRRGTTGLAVAVAALAVPMLPNAAFGAAGAHAPHTRHGLHQDRPVPGPDMVTVQEWTASGWTLTVPEHPADPADAGLLQRVMAMHHHGHYVPWLAEHARPFHVPGPVVLPDGSRAARSRAVPTPLNPTTRPANTKQMMSPHRILAAADPSGSSCRPEADTVDKDMDSYMVARLHPATDPMNVVVTHRRTACAVKVDYLSQARA